MSTNKSSLLINETPLQVLPTLAATIGLNEAIFVQQLHWLLIHSGKSVKGQEGTWIYNTIEEWHTKYPFWSTRTIKRIVKDLKAIGVLRVGRFNKMAIDQTRWYSIDYEVLNSLSPIVPTCHNGLGQNGTMTLGQNGPMLPKNKNTYQRTNDIPPNGAAGVEAAAEKPKAKRQPKPPQDMTAHQAVIEAYVTELGYNPPNGAAMGSAAAWLVKQGYTPEQVRDCYRHFKAKPFYADKPLTLQTIKTNIPEYVRFIQSQPEPSPTEAECLTALENVNKVIERDHLGNPILQLPKHAAALAGRGETFESIRGAWVKCKAAKSPVGAFLTWVRDNQMVVGVQGEEKVMYDDSGNKLILVHGIGWQQVSA